MQQCKRCGSCCEKGGPSLHPEDRELLKSGLLQYERLITIRKGELALFPSQDDPEPTEQELVKIGGKGRDWECSFFDRGEKSCSIYEHRPLECRQLQCWDSSALEEIAGHNVLTRIDIISPDDPIMEYILQHERECPIPEQEKFFTASSPRPEGKEALEALTELVRKDLAIRAVVAEGFNLSLPLELFYFGRPIHVMLDAYGMSAREDNGNVVIERGPLPRVHVPPAL
jgi:Fe-S-cluster containining protein